MKKHILLLLSAVLCLCNCQQGKTDPEVDDPTKFSTSSIVGIWAAVYSDGEVAYYYDIRSDSHLLYVERNEGYAHYQNGSLYQTTDVEWGTAGDMEYVFDTDHQTIRCLSGQCWGFSVSFLVGLLGSDVIFNVERIGLDEAWIYDNTGGWLKDAHVYRIKNTITE